MKFDQNLTKSGSWTWKVDIWTMVKEDLRLEYPRGEGSLDLRSVDFMKFDQNLTKMIKIDQI